MTLGYKREARAAPKHPKQPDPMLKLNSKPIQKVGTPALPNSRFKLELPKASAFLGT